MITLQSVREGIASGPFSADWNSLSRHENPAWFSRAKFGIFVHWGLFTVPQFRNEWYPRNMYIEGYPEFDHHVATYGPQTTFGYKDFIPLFTARAFDADEWMRVFQRAGAQYVMPVSEHHDGFQMYRSDLSQYNAVEMGPHRDVLGELGAAARACGLHFTVSNHRAEHWWFLGHGRNFDSDISGSMARGDFYWPSTSPEPAEFDIYSEAAPSREFLEDWLLRVCEIVDRYEPELLYFDWWVQHASFEPYRRMVAAYYYNRMAGVGKQASICYKYDAFAWGSGIVDMERGGFDQPTSFVWQTDTSIARNSWCYTDSLDYKTLPELLVNLIDTVSKNGNLLLNVGPRGDGSLAPTDVALLEGMGQWLECHGEGIYATTPWKICQEGPTRPPSGMFADQQTVQWTPHDWRFTAKDGVIYAFCLNPDNADTLTMRTFAAYEENSGCPPFNAPIEEVRQLGVGPVSWNRDGQGLHVTPHVYGGEDAIPVGFAIHPAGLSGSSPYTTQQSTHVAFHGNEELQ